ncbi:site-specific DNA-methyltransferase [uncultured Alistipes sp.]|uniref:site-specific DNA-methyltransferase n=1 Tax=uncultured Alistipes sp. TaxID=538949 RepID=UPI00262C4035|nr:site-specific DNA-methyltransferase [uncultured Alistipes sp.]
MNKNELANKIRGIDGLTNDEKSALIGLLRKQKKYGLVWEDKPEDVEERLREELPVLIEDTGKAIISGEADAPNHILIEGDNLEALTALAYTHEGQIDVIYIDPPYNTGNKDFVYNDQFVDKEDSYRHSKWLSFMSKRLRIAKRLLSDKGVIFISIDDNEQAQLKLLCDEVFGQDKFVATIPWRKRTAKSDVPHYLSQDYEWVLCYANEDYTAGIQKETRKYYETDDFPNRPWRVHDLTKQTTAIERPNSFFTITNPKNKEEYPANPNRTWAITKETFEEYYKQNRIVFPGDYDFLKISKPALRYWKEDDEAKTGERFGFTTVSSYINENVGMTQDGTKDITEIFGEKAFGFPKPLSLIKYILKISNPHFKELIILDFFAGSGTTLHATMQLNAEDGGHRKCILVTNNENNICEEVTYERNKRVIQGYITPKGEKVPGLTSNTLRYYRTDFISRDRTPRNMRALVAASTDLLCIKNDIYKEAKLAGRNINPKIARYFAEGGRSMLVIYDERAVSAIAEILETVEPGKEKIKVYVFSAGSYAYDDEFEEVADKVQLCALPDAIYQAYQKVLPRRRPKFLPEVMEEAGQSKANENGMFHFTDKEAEA